MRLFPCLIVSIFAAQFVQAAPEEIKNGRDILMKANEASSKLNAVAFTAQMFAEGPLQAQMPKISGKVVARKHPQTRVEQVRIEGTSTTTTPSTLVDPQVYVSNGTNAFLMEQARKAFMSGRPADARDRPLVSLYPPKYLTDFAFNEELHANTITHNGTQTVEGDECDVLVVKYDVTGSRTDRIFIARKDRLTRRIERGIMYRLPGQAENFNGLLVFVASAFDLNPKVDDKTFLLDRPQDYRNEEFRPQPGGMQIGSEAPEWEMKSPEGKTVTLKSLRGKVVVLDFWATWCGPCKMAMPGMQKLHERFKDKPVLVYGANCWERGGDPMAFIKSKNYTYPQLLSADRAAMAYGVSGIPTMVVISPEGKILFRTSGYAPQAEEAIASTIEKALSDKPR